MLATRVPPPVLVALFAGLMALLARLAPGPPMAWLVALRPWASVVLVALGLAVAAAGIRDFRRHQTTLNPMAPQRATALVRDGIYAYSRNPMYLGMLLLLAAWAAWLADGFSALALPAFVLCLNRLQIIPEERALRQRFGSEFDAWASTVRRWL